MSKAVDVYKSFVREKLGKKVRLYYREGNGANAMLHEVDTIPVHGAHYLVMDDNHSAKSAGGIFDIIQHGGIAVRFKIEQLPACCGILIGTDIETDYKGLFRATAQYCLDAAVELGYTRFMCTEINRIHLEGEQGRILKALKSLGMREVEQFKNKRTANMVSVFIKDLI